LAPAAEGRWSTADAGKEAAEDGVSKVKDAVQSGIDSYNEERRKVKDSTSTNKDSGNDNKSKYNQTRV
jgi:hypothetical protein